MLFLKKYASCNYRLADDAGFLRDKENRVDGKYFALCNYEIHYTLGLIAWESITALASKPNLFN